MIQRRDLLLSDVIAQLRAGTPVAFSRWGDGEWAAILGKPGQNCDGHAYTAELQQDLAQVLEARPAYYLGLQSAAIRRYGHEIKAWLQTRGLDLPWVPSDLWHHASMRDELRGFLEVLRTRGVCVVGPRCLLRLDLPIVGYIEVPSVNCHGAVEFVVDSLCAAMLARGKQRGAWDYVVSLSASMSANVIVHRVHQQFPDATLLDLGSLWEPYVGVASRTYHAKIIAREATRA